MGIVKALIASVESQAADQWKEFFYCESIPADLIMIRAIRQQSAQSANKGNADIITDGSVIAVADGECAIVVSNGKVISVFKEAGENIFRSGETASVFSGSGMKAFGKELGRRISFGGDAPAVKQRVYYMNTKEIPGNECGLSIPFRIHDPNLKLDVDCKLEVSGLFSFRICDPEKIYRQLIGRELRGIELVSLGFDRFCLSYEDMHMIGELQRNAVLTNMEMAAATLAGAQAQAMKDAAANPTAGAWLGLGLLSTLK